MINEIKSRFDKNLSRIQGLMLIYERISVDAKSDDLVSIDDILRACIVLLHASLEDVIRSLLEWKLPDATFEELSNIPLEGTEGKKTKFSLGDIAERKTLLIDDIVRNSIFEYLEKHNLNHFGDIKRDLLRIGIQCPIIEPKAPALAAIMKCRHWIVHRADRNPKNKSGHHEMLPISKTDLNDSIDIVKFVVDSIIVAIDKPS